MELNLYIHEDTTGILTVRIWGKKYKNKLCNRLTFIMSSIGVYNVFTVYSFVPEYCCCTVQHCSPGWWGRDGRHQVGRVRAELLTAVYLRQHPVPENEMISAQKRKWVICLCSAWFLAQYHTQHLDLISSCYACQA